MKSTWALAFASACCLVLSACAAPREDEPEYVPESLGGPPRRGEAASAAWASTATPVLTLEQCLRIAQENSRRLGIATRRVLIADDRVDEVIAGILPRLEAEGRFTARSNDAGVQRPGQPGISFQEREVGTATLSAIVPLYSFGRAENAYDAAKLGVQVAELDARRVEQDLELAVRNAYFRLLEAEKIKTVVDDSIEVIDRQLAVARDFFTQQLVAKPDVLSVEVQLAERQQERILATNNVELARLALNRVLGLDIDQRTEVEDVLATTTWSGALRDVLRQAIEQRPDLEAARQRIGIAQAQWRATRSEFFPVIFAFGSFNYTTDEFQLNDDWLSGGAAIRVPIFDGGVTYTRLQQRRREVDEAVDLRDERIDDVLLDVRQAYLEQRAASERIPVAQKAVELGDENLRIVRDLYGQGLVSSVDVLIEEDRLSRARVSYYRALYAYHQAQARLINALGGPLE